MQLTCKGDAGTGTRRLIHLPIHQGALRLGSLIAGLDDARLNHLSARQLSTSYVSQ